VGEGLPDANLNQIVTPAARPAVAKIANYCLYAPEVFGAVPNAVVLGFGFLSNPPWEVEPWKTLVAQNNPGQAPTRVPIFISQGHADTVVDPAITATLVKKLCANGETVDLRIYPGVGRVDAGQLAAPDAAEWIADRSAGKPGPRTCTSA
jgi:Secretory lipase